MITNLLIALFISVGISALGIFLAGLPGALILWLAQPLIVLIFGRRPFDKIQPSASFALIYGVSILWSISIWPGYWVAFTIFRDYVLWRQIPIFIGVLYVASTLLSTVLYGWIYLFYRVPR